MSSPSSLEVLLMFSQRRKKCFEHPRNTLAESLKMSDPSVKMSYSRLRSHSLPLSASKLSVRRTKAALLPSTTKLLELTAKDHLLRLPTELRLLILHDLFFSTINCTTPTKPLPPTELTGRPLNPVFQRLKDLQAVIQSLTAAYPGTDIPHALLITLVKVKTMYVTQCEQAGSSFTEYMTVWARYYDTCIFGLMDGDPAWDEETEIAYRRGWREELEDFCDLLKVFRRLCKIERMLLTDAGMSVMRIVGSAVRGRKRLEELLDIEYPMGPYDVAREVLGLEEEEG
ncbi:MAG: hypothetical protein M1828_007444 [Chrysothrix sp. TS-e1954]|nr:MAG: hypothetical protein M1828_007444 [Chrysothrix sp. TS-e1954]